MTGAEFAIIALMAAGTATAAYGQYQEGKAANQQAKSEAAWHNYNANVAKREAEAEKEAGRKQGAAAARRADAFGKKQRSLIGASGVNVEGSPLLVMEDSAERFKLEEIEIRTQSQRRSAKWESQSVLDQFSASSAKSRGSAAASAGKWGAAGTSLKGGAAAYGQYNKNIKAK